MDFDVWPMDFSRSISIDNRLNEVVQYETLHRKKAALGKDAISSLL